MPLILLTGDNLLEIGEALQSLRQPFNAADILAYDGTSVSLTTLSEACLTTGLFDPMRLVIVHNLHERMKGARRDTAETTQLNQVLHSVAPTTTLVLVSPGMPADHALAGFLRAAGGEARTYTIPRKNDLPRWVTSRAGEHHTTIDRDAAQLLVDLIGADTVALDTEIEKLATYAGAEGRVTLATVDALVGDMTQESIFTLVDAVAAGDLARALHLLHSQMESASAGGSDFALYLIRMLARQMRILLRIRLAQSAGRTSAQISSDLRLPPYYRDRYFRQARRLPQERLTEAFEQLARLEYGLKQGKSDASTGLDLLITELCA